MSKRSGSPGNTSLARTTECPYPYITVQAFAIFEGYLTYNSLTGIVTEGDRGLSIVLGPVVCSRKSDTSRGWDGYVPRYIQMYLQWSLQLTGVTLCPGENIVVVGT